MPATRPDRSTASFRGTIRNHIGQALGSKLPLPANSPVPYLPLDGMLWSHLQLRAAPNSLEWHVKSSGHYIKWRQEVEKWDDFLGATGLIAVKIGFQKKS